MESNLQRGADLIPNLVAATVKEFAAHERETLEAVVEARAKATSVQLSPKDLGSAQAMQQMMDAQGGLSSALSRLMVVGGRYRDLKVNQNFRWTCRISWKARKTGSAWPASVTTSRSRHSTAKFASLSYSLTQQT